MRFLPACPDSDHVDSATRPAATAILMCTAAACLGRPPLSTPEPRSSPVLRFEGPAIVDCPKGVSTAMGPRNTVICAARSSAETRRQSMAKTGKPNILFIMGDDIGWFNLSCYNHGIMGYRTPNHRPHRPRRGDVHRLLRAAELHGRTRCLRHRPVADPHRTDEGRHAGRRPRSQGRGSDHRAVPEEPRLRHRPVRQEPSRRPQRAPADRPRLRRVLRQPLSPQRRGRAGIRRLSEGSEVPEEVRPARRHASARRPTRTTRPSIRSSARSASR